MQCVRMRTPINCQIYGAPPEMIRDWSHTRTLWKRSFMGTCNLYAALMGHRESRSQYVGTPHPDLSPLGTVQLFVSTPSSAVSLLLALNQCVESSYDLMTPAAAAGWYLWPLESRSRSSPHSFQGTSPLCPASDQTTNQMDLWKWKKQCVGQTFR